MSIQLPDSESEYCSTCDAVTRVTRGRLNPDQLICFTCGHDVNAPSKAVPLTAPAVEVMSFDMMAPVEDLTYDAREERELSPEEVAVRIKSAPMSKAMRRRARRAAFAQAERQGRVVTR